MPRLIPAIRLLLWSYNIWKAKNDPTCIVMSVLHDLKPSLNIELAIDDVLDHILDYDDTVKLRLVCMIMNYS